MNSRDASNLLGLTIPFTADQAKRSYRRLAMKHHPDKGGDEATVTLLNEAYKLCSKGISFDFGGAPSVTSNGINWSQMRWTVEKKEVSMKGVVQWFAARMLDKMQVHRHKGATWRQERVSRLFKRMLGEIEELAEAMAARDKDAIIKECADVANFVMMIADNARRKL